MGGLRQIKTGRVGRSVAWEIIGNTIAYKFSGDTWASAVKKATVEEALELYRPKVSAMLRSAGFEVDDGQPLTTEIILNAIEARTGLKLGGELSRENITGAVNEMLSIYVSHELGFEVHDVMNVASIKAQIDEHIKDCVRTNTPSKLVPKRLLSKIREAAAFAQLGYSYDERRLILNRWYQKKYRRNNKLVWD